MKIAIDGMGGDYAPVEIVKGCIQAINELDINILLIGKKELLQSELKKYTFDQSKIEIVHASEIITNEDKPTQTVRHKKNSSMVIGLNMLKNKEVDVFISAGNTGALLAGSLLLVGRIKGIDRPAIASVFPTQKGISLLIDAGANAECKPRNLMEFALMGSIYTEKVLEKKNPSIGLVNIGSEEEKGTPLIKESFKLFANQKFNFYGNVEAREIPDGVVDVIVCDGFVGNVILKLAEGVATTVLSMLKKEFKKNLLNKISASILKPSLKGFKRNMDYTEYGGAPLLGINGAVIKAHGNSNAKAIKNAIIQGMAFVENEVVTKISHEISMIGDEKNGD